MNFDALKFMLARRRSNLALQDYTQSGGATDGARTRDNQNHNLGLYQLSYSRH